jgi:hypothetical protein
MVQENDPDAKWLSSWLATRVSDQKKVLSLEASAFSAAKKQGRPSHDALKEAQFIGGMGREIKVNGQSQKRQSDLPQLIDIYKGLGGTVDW